MTVPVWVLLAFAAWTLLTLLLTVGVARWSKILTGQANLYDFPADVPHGSEWYRRAVRAHANCVENLPVYGAVVVAIQAAGLQSDRLDTLAVAFLLARFCQTVTHIGFQPTNVAVALRSGFFFTQIVCMFWMGLLIVRYIV